ncbi:uncharacterized protein LOC111307694 [Durio zibethinus]|uniref:Uncharacterized protein LOC111307694 n=1 Tax=Durio zibethinus TaxID=66656 RepID=A0A6P6A9P5_DURZI|nr:uncharacterized protein LOC111307694 [Durio zibethinus]
MESRYPVDSVSELFDMMRLFSASLDEYYGNPNNGGGSTGLQHQSSEPSNGTPLQLLQERRFGSPGCKVVRTLNPGSVSPQPLTIDAFTYLKWLHDLLHLFIFAFLFSFTFGRWEGVEYCISFPFWLWLMGENPEIQQEP